MGLYPTQEFVYGIGITEEVYEIILKEETEEHVLDSIDAFCEANGYGYAVGGDRSEDWNSGVVIGIKCPNTLSKQDCTPEEQYMGGHHVAPFDVDVFVKWAEKAKQSLTREDVEKINAFLNTKQQPKLYTISGLA